MEENQSGACSMVFQAEGYSEVMDFRSDNMYTSHEKSLSCVKWRRLLSGKFGV